MISKFEVRNIEITWTLLLICFDSKNLPKNCTYEQRFISGDEITNYAANSMEFNDDPQIVSLAILSGDEHEEILYLLRQLSNKEDCDYDLEYKKFRAMYIYENLPDSDDDFMHGILKISEIWDKLGFPADSPNIYYKFNDFSQSNFKNLLDINKTWLHNEFETLKSKFYNR